jgi:hypothetical protein
MDIRLYQVLDDGLHLAMGHLSSAGLRHDLTRMVFLIYSQSLYSIGYPYSPEPPNPQKDSAWETKAKVEHVLVQN